MTMAGRCQVKNGSSLQGPRRASKHGPWLNYSVIDTQ